MKKQKKQSILNAIITILVLVLIVMFCSIVYEEKININKQTTQNTNSPEIKEEKQEEDKNNNIIEENKDNKDNEDEKEEIPIVDNEEYVGEEENQTENKPEMSIDEKAINLVKKEWGEDDSVTFSIVKKKGTKYYVAVQSGNTQNIWYEVDTTTWEVSEY